MAQKKLPSWVGTNTSFSGFDFFTPPPAVSPPRMHYGDVISVGKWNEPPTGKALEDWNAWLKTIGVPENTFGQFLYNPFTGQHAMQDLSLVRNSSMPGQYGPWTQGKVQLPGGSSTDASINKNTSPTTTPTATTPGRVTSPQVIGEIPSGNGLAYGQLTPAQRESFTAWLKANPSPQGFSARMPDANTIIPWSMIGGRPTTTPTVTPATPAITGPSPAGGTMNLSGDVMAPREATQYPNTQQYAQYLPNYTMGQGSSPLAQAYANRYKPLANPFPNYYQGRTNPFQNRRSMF